MGRYKQLQLNDQGLAFDSASGASYTINASALIILQGLKDGEDEDNIAESLANTFGIDKLIARRDVLDFFYRLECFGLMGEIK